MKNNGRLIASLPLTCRFWQDNHDELMKLCEASGRKPNEEVRDLVDEALRARRAAGGAPSPPPPVEAEDGLDHKLNELIEQHKAQNQHLTRELREYYGLLLVALAGSYGARQLIWNYVAEPRLRQAGQSPEQIAARFEAEAKVWNAERDKTADLLEQALRNLPPPK